MTDEAKVQPEHVLVYGCDHSPWVQAVLLGLYEREIAHTVITAPPLKLFRCSGVLMPAVQIDGAPWMLQSQDILCGFGFQRISDDDMLAVFRSLRGGIHRIDSGPRFWFEWSLVRDRHPRSFARLKNSFMRPFTVVYFYIALKRLARNSRTSPSQEALLRQYLYWEEQLAKSPGPFIDGDTPGTRDLMVFGGIQCHASIKVPPVSVLQSAPALTRLRDWIARMQQRFAYCDHLYSGRFFEPHIPKPSQAALPERIAFWMGSLVVLIALPITFPLARHYLQRVRKLGMLPVPGTRPRSNKSQ